MTMQKFYYYCPQELYYCGCDYFETSHSTKIAPPEYNSQYFTAFINEERNGWDIKPQILIGDFIDKNSGSKFSQIEVQFSENYTTLKDLIFNKSNECKKFYDNLRFITIRNGASGEFKCDQDLSNSVESWIRDISVREIQVYEYFYKESIIHIPLQSCIKLRAHIAMVRNFCASLCNFHLNKISQLKSKLDIDNYNYQVDKNGKQVIKFADFVIEEVAITNL